MKQFYIPQVLQTTEKSVEFHKHLDFDLPLIDILSFKKRIDVKEIIVKNSNLLFTAEILIHLYCVQQAVESCTTLKIEKNYPIKGLMRLHSSEIHPPQVKIDLEFTDFNLNQSTSTSLEILGLIGIKVRVLENQCISPHRPTIGEETPKRPPSKKISNGKTPLHNEEKQLKDLPEETENLPLVVTKVITDLEVSDTPLVITLNRSES